ncbi:daunorubicin resistance protein DrrA family ABC transporter ATP-binding protein [Paucisalibacillus sp. EB02]|uniref:daunorubicin resistance protein DrrA family ABC transporter ATP-binding protein n=1 Tax=Paucisalibacillus sp. EB02 TaxID=1347087 RepID=UPI0004ACC2C2|nr:daunorubicin resistance protein DrrA family ABC transporter ATP-binding protein [Paucisalibacillus sp. EB02]
MEQPIISVQNMNKTYGKKNVLNGLSFDINRGTIFALLGENGAGKTTTVRILSTLIKADRGTATIAGHDLYRDANKVRSVISLTGQHASVDELLTGKENLILMGKLQHLNRKAVIARANSLLEQFDLLEAANKPVKTYSGGMRRRLDIAISLLGTPEIIFLDEPTTGLDPRSRMNMWKLISELAKSGVTIFLTTQYLDEADQLADKLAIIHQGRIIEEGTAEELKSLVGEEKIELTFHDQISLDKAQDLLNGQINKQNLSISLSTDGTASSLRNVLNKLHSNHMEPLSINFRKPTLDDVFLQLTKRDREGVLQHD